MLTKAELEKVTRKLSDAIAAMVQILNKEIQQRHAVELRVVELVERVVQLENAMTEIQAGGEHEGTTEAPGIQPYVAAPEGGPESALRGPDVPLLHEPAANGLDEGAAEDDAVPLLREPEAVREGTGPVHHPGTPDDATAPEQWIGLTA